MSNDKIGCDSEGNCKAKSKADCWRFSAEFFGKNCEYKNTFGECENCHALAEAKGNDE